MHDALRQLSTPISLAEITRLQERARDVSRSPRAYPILLRLVIEARVAAPDLDGRAAATTRKEILESLETVDLSFSREALRKLLETLFVARHVELDGRHVRVTRALLDDLASLGARPERQPPGSSGAAAQSPNPSGATGHSPSLSGAPEIKDGVASYRREVEAALDELQRSRMNETF